MFKASSKLFVAFVMLFSFIGQATAFSPAISCENEAISSQSITHNAAIKHNDLKKINSETAADCCGVNCCDFDCLCMVNACSSLMLLNAEVGFNRLLVLTESYYLQKLEQPKSILTPLYRPPIFTS